MRNELSSVIFIRNCDSVFPSEGNIYDEFSCCHSVHLSRFKFLPFFDIAVKSSFCMTSNAKAGITALRCSHRVFIFVYDFTNLTLFPSKSKSRSGGISLCSCFQSAITHFRHQVQAK